MTPLEVEQAARERYNAVGETFWSSSEIMDLIYAACLEIATETECIERTYTTTTVAGTQEYPFPDQTIEIKRVTWNGRKLEPINFREDDILTGLNASTTDQGEPAYYAQWNETMVLRPIPNDAQTLKIYSINEPQEVTSTSVLEVPTFSHMRIVNYVLGEMYAKDKDFNSAKYYKDLWLEVDLPAIKRFAKKRLRRDRPARVQNEEVSSRTILGII